jgi:hypothetical protein
MCPHSIVAGVGVGKQSASAKTTPAPVNTPSGQHTAQAATQTCARAFGPEKHGPPHMPHKHVKGEVRWAILAPYATDTPGKCKSPGCWCGVWGRFVRLVGTHDQCSQEH